MCNYGAMSLPVSFHAVNNVWCVINGNEWIKSEYKHTLGFGFA